MKYQFIDTYRSVFAVEKMCRALKVSKSGYFAWKVRPQSNRARENEQLDHHIRTTYKQNRGTYGSPRITEALKKQSIACSKNRILTNWSNNAYFLPTDSVKEPNLIFL